jgi:hypothetical protein
MHVGASPPRTQPGDPATMSRKWSRLPKVRLYPSTERGALGSRRRPRSRWTRSAVETCAVVPFSLAHVYACRCRASRSGTGPSLHPCARVLGLPVAHDEVAIDQRQFRDGLECAGWLSSEKGGRGVAP